MRIVIYWKDNHHNPKTFQVTKQKIRERFNIPEYTSINGETPCNIRDEDMELLRECEYRGFIQIRVKK